MFWSSVSCRILYSIGSYLYVSCSVSITSVEEERASLLVIVWFLFGEVFLFLWVLGMGCVILLWHSLSLPYNYFGSNWTSDYMYGIDMVLTGNMLSRLSFQILS